MKKIISLITVLIFGFSSVPLSFATSGACSGHRGVNCSAGPDKDGSVICNDGWKKSSVKYSTMKMCVKTKVVKKK